MSVKKRKHKENSTLKQNSSKSESTSRRNFLNKLWKGAGIIAAAEVAGLTLHFLSDEKEAEDAGVLYDAGLIDQIPDNSVIPYRGRGFYLIRFEKKNFLALSIKCPHLGCSIIWDQEADEFVCPCHSSRFSREGNVTSAPAPRAMDFFRLELKMGRIFVDLNNPRKRSLFEKDQAARLES